MLEKIPRLLAGLAALALGAVSVAAPPLALLALALLGANALAHARRLDIGALLGPVFAALVVHAFVGVAGAVGVIFVWRMLADTRWSVAEAKRLAGMAGRPAETTRRALAHAWSTPLYGLALVAYSSPHMIAGLPLDLPHVPLWAPLGAGAIASFMVFDWALKRAVDWRLGELAAAPATHLLAHHVMFVLAFGLMLDVSAGIVAMAAWRLLQAAPLPFRAANQASLTAVP